MSKDLYRRCHRLGYYNIGAEPCFDSEIGMSKLSDIFNDLHSLDRPKTDTQSNRALKRVERLTVPSLSYSCARLGSI